VAIGIQTECKRVARYMECILLVRNCERGDDVNCEVTTDMFIL
jgi:hypothetical protein